MTTDTAATTDNSRPQSVDPKALGATATRYLVPALVGLLISLAAKVGLNLTQAQAYGYVAPAVATVYSTIGHYAEAKFPALSLMLGAKRPTTLTK